MTPAALPTAPRGKAMTDNKPMTDEELLQIIKQAADEGWTELDLSFKGLTRLPPEIGELTSLRKLAIEDNFLTELPMEIGKLTKLISLSISGNQLTSLPSTIVSLVNLETIKLSHNSLSTLPTNMNSLTKLNLFF
jgi:internalin A